MDHNNDETLVEKSKDGDLHAFKILVQRHEGKVAGVIRGMLGKTQEAEDVGQEVFIRFYESLSNFRGDAAVSTYLIRIAINLSLNELKRRKKKSFFSIDLAEGKATEKTEDRHDLKEMLEMEINRLEPEFRAVVTLRLVEGYSTQETAEILKIPLGTVLSRLARSQKKLQSRLSKYLIS